MSVRENVRKSSARKRAVPKLYVGDRVWYQMKACKVLSSSIINHKGCSKKCLQLKCSETRGSEVVRTRSCLVSYDSLQNSK
jgi:hypothetical protein